MASLIINVECVAYMFCLLLLYVFNKIYFLQLISSLILGTTQEALVPFDDSISFCKRDVFNGAFICQELSLAT